MIIDSFIKNVHKTDWQYLHGQEGNDDAIRWKTLLGGDDSPTRGITMGILEIPPQKSIDAHRHCPSECYYVYEGRGSLLIGREIREVGPGDAAYIRGNEVHGLKNIGSGTLKIIWMFPTDSWGEIEYHMEKRTF